MRSRCYRLDQLHGLVCARLLCRWCRLPRRRCLAVHACLAGAIAGGTRRLPPCPAMPHRCHVVHPMLPCNRYAWLSSAVWPCTHGVMMDGTACGGVVVRLGAEIALGGRHLVGTAET